VAGDQASIGIFVGTGSAYENLDNNGLTNILAQIAKNENQPEEGVVVTAFSDRENLGLVAQTSSDNVDGAFKTLSRVFSSIVDGKNLEERKKATLESLELIDWNSKEFALDHLHSVAYQGNSLALPVSGNTKSVSNISKDNLRNYVANHLTGGRIVVSAAGNFSHDQVVSGAKFLGSLPEKSSFQYGQHPGYEYTGSMVALRDDDLHDLSLAIGMKAVGHTDPDYFTFKVIEKIVGNWNRQFGNSWGSTSPLVNASIEEGKVMKSITPYFLSYHSTGILGVYSLTTDVDCEDACYHIFKEWIRISYQASTTEVEKAKNRVLREFLSNISSTNGLAKEQGLQILRTASSLSPEDIVSKIQNITKADVRNVAFKYLTDNDPVVAAIGPTGFVPDYNQLRGWTYWNRL
jgi:processing peptidase subunit beta